VHGGRRGCGDGDGVGLMGGIWQRCNEFGWGERCERGWALATLRVRVRFVMLC
jgi:hypothetical protein